MPVISNSNSPFLGEEESWGFPDEDNCSGGLTVECICPKCGVSHRMKLFWSGRGKPKKYCQPCKSFVSTIESIDFCGTSAAVSKNAEEAV